MTEQNEKTKQRAEYIITFATLRRALITGAISESEFQEIFSCRYDEAAIIRKAQEEERERIIKKAETVVNTIRRETIYELLKSFGYNCVGQQETCICNVCNAAGYCAEIRDKEKKEINSGVIRYYPITENEISFFVRSSGSMDQKTRSLAQEIYSRGMISLSGDVALIKDLNYEIYKLKKDIGNPIDTAIKWLFKQFKERTAGLYRFGDNEDTDWWIERIGYLRTDKGKAELRDSEQE